MLRNHSRHPRRIHPGWVDLGRLWVSRILLCGILASAVLIALPTSGPTLLCDADDATVRVTPSTSQEGSRKPCEILDFSLPPKGFRPIFNGRDITGWGGTFLDPIQRRKLPKIQFAQQRAIADNVARAHWYVLDGDLVFSGRGDNLMTYEEFGDMELLIDWKIPANADTGVFIRGTPQIQIWDHPDEGSGGLYNNREHASEALLKADYPVGEWNHFHIVSVGDRVSVHLNNELVTFDTIMENYWDRDQPLLKQGPIELQRHTRSVSFRNISVRPIATPPIRCEGESVALDWNPKTTSHAEWSLYWLWEGDAQLAIKCHKTLKTIGAAQVSIPDPLVVARTPLIPDGNDIPAATIPGTISGKGLRGKIVTLEVTFGDGTVEGIEIDSVTLSPKPKGSQP